jgi:DNA (cytosine-5)-methyltransferase 1
MSQTENVLFNIADHPTPKIDKGGVAYTLNSRDYKATQCVTVLESHPHDSRLKVSEDGIFQTLSSRMGTGGGNTPMIVDNLVVRRLTPLECERLQGYPDGWTDIGDWIDSKGKKHKGDSDAPRLKALGNSIALPFWEWMAGRMVAIIKNEGVEHPTMASLFDGISGFPLVYSRNGCEPVWSSEIEDFPIAVAKVHFPDESEVNNE